MKIDDLKCVILAGGFGTRISEETHLKPKPLVEIGGKPILWHVMKLYSFYGVRKFIICVGYKGYLIKEYFANYFLHMSDVTIDLEHNDMTVHQKFAEPWQVTIVDTGEESMTGGRLKRVKNYLDDSPFFFTYGDGVADVDVSKLLDFHISKNTLATVTAVQPPGRYGVLDIDNDKVNGFVEKPKGEGGWINGGFFVLNKKCLEYIDEDITAWEHAPLTNLACEGELCAYKHNGFWHAMDTLRDKNTLEMLWSKGESPWKVW